MHNYKKLIVTVILYSHLFSDGGSFRGKGINEIMGSRIPISFANLIVNNYNIPISQINPQRGSFLIIAPDGVLQYLPDFISFKKSQGFDVLVAGLSEAGTSAENIKEYIRNSLIDDPMLEYVLLIGDVDGFAAFPSFYYGPENDVTDQKFTYLFGEDNVPDVFIGRLSIDSLSDLAVIMAKTIQYARNPLAFDSDWLSRGLIVAGNYANTYPIPITPKWTSYWLRDELIDYGYSQIDTVFYPPIQQGSSYIIPSIDNGVGIVNYRGWGDANGWHYPEFHVDNVNELNNGWLTPVFMSYVCNSNDFANNVDPCLAEAVIRGGTPNVPKGGVAFIGPSDLHTSTKYNNVINAYMYDAMLNKNITELGPAMQAGQNGLTKEFPAQSGPGEAQEFYAHVYNILGDPSLSVYLDTPNQFQIMIDQINSNDGAVKLEVLNLSGNPVEDVVISIMVEDEILTKGKTDSDGIFISKINVDEILEVGIYANKNGFIQGYKSVSISSNLSPITISELNVDSGLNEIPTMGEEFSISLQVKNNLNVQTEEINGLLTFSGITEPSNFPITIPSLNTNESYLIENINLTAYQTPYLNAIHGELKDDDDPLLDIIIDCRSPLLIPTFINEGTPDASFNPSLEITNYSKTHHSDIYVKISSISDGAIVERIDDYNLLSTFSPYGTSIEELNYQVQLEDIAYGSEITFLVEFQKNNINIHDYQLPILITPTNDNLPVAPSNYGYWAYDDLDIDFIQVPTFDWIELDPEYGGIYDNHYQLDDDDHVDLTLPFSFRYHGINYDQITVSSNGWASFEPCDIDYFWNMSIPMYMGPKALLAPFSDDLETIDSDGDGNIDVWINVFTFFDENAGKFIIEWSRALNGYDELTEETFQIILYNQNSKPTQTGDGVIEFQYLEIDDVDVTKNYSTVGIEAPEKNYGLQYAFNNVYAPGAAPLEDNRIIRFTTESPENFIAALEVENLTFPTQPLISKIYPNPFNPIINFNINVLNAENIKVQIIDILGKEVKVIKNAKMVPGEYKMIWDGRNKFGNLVSSGTYFLSVSSKTGTELKKVLFLK